MPVLLGGSDRRPPRTPPPGRTGRPAGVLVLLYPDDDGLARVVLTERASRDGHHSGEVSFPGGEAEPDDADITATALREAAEEIALDAVAAGVRVIGLLDRFWIPVSDFEVHPVVAVAPSRPVADRLAGRGRPDRRAADGRASCPARRSRWSSGRSASGRCATARTTSTGCPCGARPPGS